MDIGKMDKISTVAQIISSNYTPLITRILVVGCGDGIEAAVLAQNLNADVVGIDIIDNFNERAKKYAHLEQGNAMSLQFEDRSFDFVFSNHALEHIENPGTALREMSRVLKCGGGYWITAPNRSRVIGYIGSVGVSKKTKLAWNIKDWKAKITGKFRNELGAHAGFSFKELCTLLSHEFSGNIQDMSCNYYLKVYKNQKKIITLLDKCGLRRYLFPAYHFMGENR